MGSVLRNRLKPGEEDFKYNLQRILGHAVHMDPRRVLDRFLRYERLLQMKSKWTPLDFDGKQILEIGCGPMLGIAPIAVYLGATRCVCIDPRFQAEVLESDEVWNRFFLQLYQQLDALFDRGIGYDEFADRVRSRIQINAVKIEEHTETGDPVDVVYSNSVLQHIGDLDGAMAMIRQVSDASTRQLHVVNFSDHFSPPDDPFREMYRLDPDEYFEHDSLLNLKRPSEIAELFNDAGIPVSIVPYISNQSAVPGVMAPYWSRFDESDLAIQIAFFVNREFNKTTKLDGSLITIPTAIIGQTMWADILPMIPY